MFLFAQFDLGSVIALSMLFAVIFVSLSIGAMFLLAKTTEVWRANRAEKARQASLQSTLEEEIADVARLNLREQRAQFHFRKADQLLVQLKGNAHLVLNERSGQYNQYELSRLLERRSMLLEIVEGHLHLARCCEQYRMCGAGRYHKVVQVVDRKFLESNCTFGPHRSGHIKEILEFVANGVMLVQQALLAEEEQNIEPAVELLLNTYAFVDGERRGGYHGDATHQWARQIERYHAALIKHKSLGSDRSFYRDIVEIGEQIRQTPARILSYCDYDAVTENEEAWKNFRDDELRQGL